MTQTVSGHHAFGPATGDASASPARIPRAVTNGPDRLSASARTEINRLCGARPVRFWFSMAVTWASIACAITLGVMSGSAVVVALCVFFVATRQVVLGLLMHEQVHRLGDRSKFADWFVNVFAVYPLFITTVEDYAKVHLSHHKYFMTSKDPDYVRKSGEEWTFPTSVRKLIAIAARDLSSINTFQLIRGKTAPPKLAEFERSKPSPKWLRLGFYGAVALALTATQTWSLFLLYWVLPLLTITQLFVRWIAVVEHQYNVEDADVRDVTPLVLLKWWQKALMPDMNFAMHVYHHMHPGIAFSQLPKVHQIYRREGLVDDSAIFHGQGAYLNYLARGNSTSAAPTVVPQRATKGIAAQGVRQAAALSLVSSVAADPFLLIAETNDVNALILERSLRELGIRTRRVLDGQVAIQAALANPRPFAMLVASHLANGDGLSVAHTIRAVESSSGAMRLPIVLTSALDVEVLHNSTHLADVDQILAMPFDDRALERAIAPYRAVGKELAPPVAHDLASLASDDELARV